MSVAEPRTGVLSAANGDRAFVSKWNLSLTASYSRVIPVLSLSGLTPVTPAKVELISFNIS